MLCIVFCYNWKMALRLGALVHLNTCKCSEEHRRILGMGREQAPQDPETPLTMTFHPELDASPELGPKEAA